MFVRLCYQYFTKSYPNDMTVPIFLPTQSPFFMPTGYVCKINTKLEDHWSCIAHLSAEDMLKSVVIEEKK